MSRVTASSGIILKAVKKEKESIDSNRVTNKESDDEDVIKFLVCFLASFLNAVQQEPQRRQCSWLAPKRCRGLLTIVWGKSPPTPTPPQDMK